MVKMAGSIRLFQFYQECHRAIGIYQTQVFQRHLSFNWKNATVQIAFAQLLLTTIAFTVIDAKSMIDYGIAFYTFITINASEICVLIYIHQSVNTFKFIETCEEFIKKSKISISIHIFCLYKRPIRIFITFFYAGSDFLKSAMFEIEMFLESKDKKISLYIKG